MNIRGLLDNVAAIGALSLVAVSASAEWESERYDDDGDVKWELYDDFDDGVINRNLWAVDNDSANITEKNGYAIFKTKPEVYGNSSGLRMIDGVEDIKGIRARVRLKGGCGGDVRVRVAGYAGENGNGHFNWVQIGLRTMFEEGVEDFHRVQIGITPDLGPEGNYAEQPDELWGGAPEGHAPDLVVTGKWVILQLRWDNPSKTHFKNTLQSGVVTKSHSPPLEPMRPDESVATIGTRTRLHPGGKGECRAWFDWVDVLRAGGDNLG